MDQGDARVTGSRPNWTAVPSRDIKPPISAKAPRDPAAPPFAAASVDEATRFRGSTVLGAGEVIGKWRLVRVLLQG